MKFNCWYGCNARLDIEIKKKIFQFLLNTYTFSLRYQYIRQMTAEEFNYYNNAPIRMSQHQNFTLKKRWRLKSLADHLGILIPILSKIKTDCTVICLSHLKQIAGVYKTIVVKLLSIEKGQTGAGLNSNLSIPQRNLADRDREIINLQNKSIYL